MTGTKSGATSGAAGAPTISGVAAKSVTAASATVTWSTNVAATSMVNYGLTTSYGSQTSVNSNLVLGHSMGLSGLSAAKTYHYQVVSADQSGAETNSQDFTFTTSGSGAPTISEVSAGGITTSNATITWTTNVPTTSQVIYGTTASYGQQSPLNSTLATSHLVMLSGLASSKTYHYQAVSKDSSGNQVTSGDFTFTTTATAPAPTISGVGSSNVTATGATISWTTNVPTTSQVNYGTTASYGQASAVNSTLATSHSVALSGLSASATYHYQAISKDGSGNQVASGELTFTTTATAPAPTISGVGSSNVTASGATISWTTNVPTTSQVRYGTTASYGQTSTVNSTLATSHSVTLSGLSASTTYHYQAVSVDGPGTQAASSDFTFATAAATPPTISAVSSTNITSSSATIIWTTNVGATSQVNYGTSSSYGQQSSLSAALVVGHAVNLVGLASSTTYHYQAASTNGAGQAASTDFTFTTSAPTSGGVSFPAGQWTKLNNNTALQMGSAGVDHCPANGFGGSGYNFDNNCAGVVNAWTGFGYTTSGPDGACMIEAGGGHSDYAGNELYEMCPAFDNGAGNAPGTKVRLTNPSEPASSCSSIDPLVSPTAPDQGHSYQFFVVAPNTNKLYRWAIIGGTVGGDACANFNLWALDLSSVNMGCAPNCNAQWTQISGVMPTGEGLVEAHGVFNHVDGKIWTWEPYGAASGSEGCVGVFDPVAVTFSHQQCFSTNSAEYMDMAIDESQNVAVIMGNSGCPAGCAEAGFTGQIWVDLTGADGFTLHQPPLDPSCATLAAAQSPGLDYDSARHTIVGWPGTGNALYYPRVNKSNGSITCTTVSAGSTQGTDFPNPMGTDGGSGGTLGKFHYDPVNDIYVLDVVFDQPAWVFKP